MQQIARVDAARTNRSLVPAAAKVQNRLRADPLLLLQRRLIDTAVAEAKATRFGEPTDGAILARWWIWEPDDPTGKMAEYRSTFERCCLLLELDVATERVKLLGQIDDHWQQACERYMRHRLQNKIAAVLTIAKCKEEMSENYAHLLVSELEFEDTAGVNRPDPPNWKQRTRRRRVDHMAIISA